MIWNPPVLSADELGKYIAYGWYQDNLDAAWYDSDQRHDDTYCGYWCFIGAAIAAIMKFDRSHFENTKFFPLDLMP